jgi:hypothetical protein
MGVLAAGGWLGSGIVEWLLMQWVHPQWHCPLVKLSNSISALAAQQ